MNLFKKINSFIFVEEDKKKVLNKKVIWGLLFIFFIICLVLLLFTEKKEKVTREKINIEVDNLQSARLQPESLKANANKSLSASKNASTQVPSGKTEFLKPKLPGPEFIARPGSEKIPPGTMIKAVLENGATDGPIKAKLQENLVVMGNVVFESESILIGIAESQENRLNIRFHHIKNPNDGVFEIRSVALDYRDQTLGLAASQFNSESIKLGASIGLNFVSGLSEGLKEKTNLNGTVTDTNSTRNAFLNGTEKASLEYSRDLMNEIKNKKRNLYVEKGTDIWVFFE